MSTLSIDLLFLLIINPFSIAICVFFMTSFILFRKVRSYSAFSVFSLALSELMCSLHKLSLPILGEKILFSYPVCQITGYFHMAWTTVGINFMAIIAINIWTNFVLRRQLHKGIFLTLFLSMHKRK